MTANLTAEAARALGLVAVGDEAEITVTNVNSDGSVVVSSEDDSMEDAAPMPAAAAVPEELSKMLGT
jgi:hypothetical protein